MGNEIITWLVDVDSEGVKSRKWCLFGWSWFHWLVHR